MKSKGPSEHLTKVEEPKRAKTPLNANEPTSPYIIGQELNLNENCCSVVGSRNPAFQTAAIDGDKD